MSETNGLSDRLDAADVDVGRSPTFSFVPNAVKPLAYIDAVEIHIDRFYEGKVGGTFFGVTKNSYELVISIAEAELPGRLIKAYDTNRFDVVGSGSGEIVPLGIDFKILGSDLVKLSRERGKYDDLKTQIAQGKTNLPSGLCLRVEVFRLKGRERGASVCTERWEIMAIPETRTSKGRILVDGIGPFFRPLGEHASPLLAMSVPSLSAWAKHPGLWAHAGWVGYGGASSGASSRRDRARAVPPPPTLTRFQLVYDRALPVEALPPAGKDSWSMSDEKTWLNKFGDGLESRFVWKERTKVYFGGEEIAGAVFTKAAGPTPPPNDGSFEIFIPDKGSKKMPFYSRLRVKGGGDGWFLVGTMKDFD